MPEDPVCVVTPLLVEHAFICCCGMASLLSVRHGMFLPGHTYEMCAWRASGVLLTMFVHPASADRGYSTDIIVSQRR